MAKRVAVLLIGNLSEALRKRSIKAANSEPYWLRPDQYHEHGDGVEFIPESAPGMVAYCKKMNMYPLGLVALAENGDYADYIDSDYISRNEILSRDQKFVTSLFQMHAHFWFCVVPWLQSQVSSA